MKIIKNSMDFQFIGQKDQKMHLGKIQHKGLFGIIQGGLFKDLRIKSLNELIKIGF